MKLGAKERRILGSVDRGEWLSALLTTASFIAFRRTRELVGLLGFFLFGGCTVYAQRRRRSH